MTQDVASPQRGMDLVELLRVIWRWKIVVFSVTAIVLLIAFAALRLVTEQYESSTTLAIKPASGEPDFFLYQTIDSIVPIYADAAKARSTEDAARRIAGFPIGEVSVQAIDGTPLMRVRVRDPDPERAEKGVQAISDAVVERAESGELGITTLTLAQLDRPSAATDPVFPRVELTLLVAGLLGLLVGCVAAVIGESFRARVDTADAVEDLLGIPCYAEVPLETVVPRVYLLGSLGSDPRLRGMHEALRDVRTNLQLEDGIFRSIVITSPDGHHGKTTIAAGLATTLAKSGRRTLLVDGDLRRGRIADVTGLGPGPGLMEALTGTPVGELTRSTEVEGLHVLTRGDVAADPGDLLRAYPSVLRQIREEYDVTVIDTTPLLPINDARVLAGFSDVILLVVSVDGALKRRLQAAVDRLTVLSLRPTAFILNRSRERIASDYYFTIPERAGRRPAPRS
jgi:capsular exopolysaccharide synthesis family protein